ncbi:hypothetical protein LB566_23375 [Mesorhizobium sp. CA13]|uniref:hypothetical protein n=1 Tax=Mesorhizobium sp. CA13 TaxID=2876643 RepID=UPI001CC99463|nr:hypothetical protein [Mesorhizobium sp. CA13]MBZ9856737.1 hypothetical protein [Mesorhizobium sp. CA13]
MSFADQRVPISFSLDRAMYAGLERRAQAMGKKPVDYIRMLTEAAYLARIGREKQTPSTDRDLDEAVRAVFCLSGEFSTAAIAKVTGLAEGLVVDILGGLKTVARQRRSA